jgi:hypothetical protein
MISVEMKPGRIALKRTRWGRTRRRRSDERLEPALRPGYAEPQVRDLTRDRRHTDESTRPDFTSCGTVYFIGIKVPSTFSCSTRELGDVLHVVARHAAATALAITARARRWAHANSTAAFTLSSSVTSAVMYCTLPP